MKYAAGFLVVFALMFQSSGSHGDTVKNIVGGKMLLNNLGETFDFRFNVPSLVPQVNKVETSEINNGKLIVESYYVGEGLVARSQYAVFGGFNSTTTAGYEDESIFLDRIGKSKFYKDRLSGGATNEYAWGSANAVEVRKDNCYWLHLGKRIKPSSDYTGRSKDLLVSIVGCLSLNDSPKELLRKLGHASDVDKMEFASRRQ